MIYKKRVTMLTGYTKLTTHSHDNQANYIKAICLKYGPYSCVFPVVLCDIPIMSRSPRRPCRPLHAPVCLALYNNRKSVGN